MLKIELGVLMTMTAGRRDDAETIIRVYARALQEYPADCVISAIRSIQKTAKFFPAISELIADVEWRAKPRQLKRDALLNMCKLHM